MEGSVSNYFPEQEWEWRKSLARTPVFTVRENDHPKKENKKNGETSETVCKRSFQLKKTSENRYSSFYECKRAS